MPHATGHLRQTFCDWVEAYSLGVDHAELCALLREENIVSIDRLFGMLWNCNDILPGTTCSDLSIPLGSTYAQAVRGLRKRFQLMSRLHGLRSHM